MKAEATLGDAVTSHGRRSKLVAARSWGRGIEWIPVPKASRQSGAPPAACFPAGQEWGHWSLRHGVNATGRKIGDTKTHEAIFLFFFLFLLNP